MKSLKKIWKKSSDGETAEDFDPKSVGPHVLYDGTDNSSSGVDIIFVHGLRGSAYKTWSKGAVCWPRDLLKNDIPKGRIITWGYDADVAHFFSNASKESIFGHADTLLGDLARLRQDITRPIAFVAHSLGGLVVKAALIKSAEYKSHNRHPRQAEIYASTSGVAFFGTPHRGSSKEGYGEILAGIAKFSLRQPNKSLLETLRQDSHILEGQRDAWTTISNDMSVICVREEVPTAIGMIVPEASASYDGFNVQRSSINANHSDMVKFDTREDPMYQRAVGLLVGLTKTSLALDEDHLRSQLQRLSFVENHGRELGIDDAHESTFKWIASQQTIMRDGRAMKFATWIDSSHNGLFIGGKAASGKSTFMKYLKDTQMTLIKGSHWAADSSSVFLATFFFYEQGSDLQKSREGMLRSLISQILRQEPMRLFDADSTLNWRSLRAILDKAIEGLESRGKKLFLFIDGLDEFRLMEKLDEYTNEQTDLIYDGDDTDASWGSSTWIMDGHREVSNLVLELCSKKNVKICFSCRELPVFEGQFRALPRLQLQRYTKEDIYHYSHRRLSKEGLGLSDIDEFASAITERASGVFLWVRLIVDKLINDNYKGNSLKELWSALEGVPNRLGGKTGLYMSMLRDIDVNDRAESARLFRLLATVHDPMHLLTLSFAAESLGKVQKDGFGSNIEVNTVGSINFSVVCENHLRRLKSRCGGLLEADPFVNFMHQTAKEFIQRPSTWNSVFGDEIDYENVSFSSAFIEGCIALVRISERLSSATEASDAQWREPAGAVVSSSDVLTACRRLECGSRDTKAYVSLLDRMKEAKILLPFVHKQDETLDPYSLRNYEQASESGGPYTIESPQLTAYHGAIIDFKDSKVRTFDSEDFMSFAVRAGLSRYISDKLSLKTPSQRVEEACRLWTQHFPFAGSCRYEGTRGNFATPLLPLGVGIETCRTLLTYVAEPNNDTTKAPELLLSKWVHALELGCCSVVVNGEPLYEEAWLELILLMLNSGVSVSTPIRISSEHLSNGSATLSSSEILLTLLGLGNILTLRDVSVHLKAQELKDLKAQVLDFIPRNLTRPTILEDFDKWKSLKMEMDNKYCSNVLK